MKRPVRVALVDVNSDSRHQTIAIGYLKAWAQADAELRAASRIELLFSTLEEPVREQAERILALEPALVGFSCYVWNVERVLQLAALVKKARPEAVVVLGGPQAGPSAKRLLAGEGAVDCVVCGEGEESFRLLLRALFLGGPALAAVPGLAYRRDGEIVQSPEPPLVDLARQPSPFLSGAISAARDSVLIEASRGCPFTCKFCDWGPRNMRYVPADRLKREFALLAGKTRSFFVCDSDLLMHKPRAVEILRGFVEAVEGTPAHMVFQANPTFLHPDIVDVIASAPSRFVPNFGIQTTNPAALKRVQRVFDREKVERNIAYLRRRAPGVPFKFEIIYGLPGDDLEGFRRTLDWVLRMRPPILIIHHALVLPGADFSKEAEELGLVYDPGPPHHVLETATMSRADMARAAELSFFANVINPWRELFDLVFPASAPDEVSRVDALEGWIESLRGTSAPLTGGVDFRAMGRDIPMMADRAFERLSRDRLLAASLSLATRRFAADRDPA